MIYSVRKDREGEEFNMEKRQNEYLGRQKDDDRDSIIKTDIWDVEDGEYSGMPVWCLLDAGMEGPVVCGKAEFGSDHPGLLFPQMEMKGHCLAQSESKLRFTLTWQTKHRSHNKVARSKWPATSAYCGNGTATDLLAQACMFCPKPWPAISF